MSTLHSAPLHFPKICSLFGQSIQTSMQNMESPAQKLSMLRSIYHSLLFPSSSALRSHPCLNASRQGHPPHRQTPPAPDVPQILLTPKMLLSTRGPIQEQSPTLRIAQSALTVVKVVRIRFIPFVSLQTSLKLAAHTEHTHHDMQRRPLLCKGRFKKILIKENRGVRTLN